MFCIIPTSSCRLGLYDPLTYLPSMAVQSGMSIKLAQYTLSIANAGSPLGRLLPSAIADRIGFFNMMYFMSTLSGVLVIAFWLSFELHPANSGIVVFAFLNSLCSGSFVSLGPPCVVSLAGGRIDELGAKLGGFCLAIALGALMGLPIEGYIKDTEGTKYAGLIIFCGTVITLGATLTGVARMMKRMEVCGQDIKHRCQSNCLR